MTHRQFLATIVGVVLAALAATAAPALAASSCSTSARQQCLVVAETATTATASTSAATVESCCYGDMDGDTCGRTSPSKGGCEFSLVYKCGSAGMTCDGDADSGRCYCNPQQ